MKKKSTNSQILQNHLPSSFLRSSASCFSFFCVAFLSRASAALGFVDIFLGIPGESVNTNNFSKKNQF